MSMPAIQAIRAREILDSQGFPTIEVELWLDNGMMVESSAPNGTGEHPFQKKPKYDQNPDHMAGKGVQQAVKLINNTIAPQLINQDPTQQEQLDQLLESLDQSENKEQIGSNTLIVLSQAIAKAGAAASGLPLYQYIHQKYKLTEFLKIPTCMYGLINGGKYGTGNLDIQEFLVIPASHVDYRVSLEVETAIREELRNILKDRKASYSTGALGGFTPHLQKNSDALEFLVEASRKTSYILSRDFFLGIDVGAQNLDQKGKYSLRDKPTYYTDSELLEFYKKIQKQYNLIYLEDPFSVKDQKSWQDLTAEVGRTTKISSDILTGSQLLQTQQAIKDRMANALVIKPSQVGTITGTINTIKAAKESKWQVIVSQRTGETNDDFLADFAVGIGSDFVKFGPTNRGEMIAKYNRLAKIYVELTYQNNNQNNQKEETTMMDPKTQTLSSTDQDANAPKDSGVTTDSTQPATQAPVTPPTSLAEPVPEPSLDQATVAPAATTPATPVAPATPTPVVNPLTPAEPEVDEAETPASSTEPTEPVEPTPTPVTPTPTAPVAPATPPSPEQVGKLVDSAQDEIKSSLSEIGVSEQTAQKPAPAGLQPSEVETPPAATPAETTPAPASTDQAAPTTKAPTAETPAK